jgi:hypothetical protein
VTGEDVMKTTPELAERWIQAVGFDPRVLDTGQLRARVSHQIRQMCTELAQREDRRGISDLLRRLAQTGSVLEENNWLADV